MPPILTFIGWHDSGKTTLASQVVQHLKERGYTIAVIKSTKETRLRPDHPGTDTFSYQQAGADAVTLVAPDQMIMTSARPARQLSTLAFRFFADMDLVVGEGFKDERQVAKIEVTRGDTELLRDRVTGVIAVVTDRKISGDYIFRLDESRELADFIEKRLLQKPGHQKEQATLLVNGKQIIMKEFVQQALAGTVQGFVKSLKVQQDVLQDIELRIRIEPK